MFQMNNKCNHYLRSHNTEDSESFLSVVLTTVSRNLILINFHFLHNDHPEKKKNSLIPSPHSTHDLIQSCMHKGQGEGDNSDGTQLMQTVREYWGKTNFERWEGEEENATPENF